MDDLSHFFLFAKKLIYSKWWSVFLTEVAVLNIENFEECILFGFLETDSVIQGLNHCILLDKYYVHYSRLFTDNKLDFYQYQVMLKQRLAIEKSI